jgi:hypothetical protein
VSRQWPPITVRDVQEAMTLQRQVHEIAREDITRALGITDRELDLLIGERRALDEGAHAYLAEHDLGDA